jgi:hypothetical protein
MSGDSQHVNLTSTSNVMIGIPEKVSARLRGKLSKELTVVVKNCNRDRGKGVLGFESLTRGWIGRSAAG